MSRIFLCVFLSLLLLSSCKDNGPSPTDCDAINPSSSKNVIMALGASRVEGNRPDFDSYRYELWKLLVDGGWDIDLIGTQCDEASYPTYADERFDRHHEGRGGWTSGQILDGISDWLLEAGAPDIVLLSSPGGNDGLSGLSYDQAVSNINAIIDLIQTANPNVIILIEQMAPARTEEMTPELTTFFNAMQEEVLTMAAEQSDSASTVITVDMFTGFSDAFLADDVHYNEEGAVFIAERYYEELTKVLQ